MHPLPEGPRHVSLAGASRVKHVRRPLSPRRIGDLGDHAVKVTVFAMEKEKRDRVESDTQVARVRQQPDGTFRVPPQTGLHELTSARRQWPIGAREVIGVAKARWC